MRTLLILSSLVLCLSCIKEKEETSTEAQNLKEDAAQVEKDVKAEFKEPADSIAKDVSSQVGQKDGFEGKKSQY